MKLKMRKSILVKTFLKDGTHITEKATVLGRFCEFLDKIYLKSL